MLIINADMSKLYVQSGRIAEPQPFRALEVNLTPEEERRLTAGEKITVHDEDLRLTASAEVLEKQDAGKVSLLVEMSKVRSLDAVTPDTAKVIPITPPHWQGSSNAPVQAVTEKKRFVANGLAAAFVSIVFGLILFNWEGFIPAFLLLNSPFDGLLLSAAPSDEEAVILFITVWLVFLLPFFGVVFSRGHWKDEGDSITGGLGAILSAMAASVSTIMAIVVIKIKFAMINLAQSESFSDMLGKIDGEEFSLLSTPEGLITLWLFFAGMWCFATLTGDPKKR